MASNSEVCRTCLSLIPDRDASHKIDEDNKYLKNIKNIREMVVMCVPEIDLYASDCSVVCEPCLKLLVSLYNFKSRCLRVERAIQNYIAKSNRSENIQLYDVVRNQMQEALLNKKWSYEQIKNYLDQVNASFTNKKKVSPMQNIENPLLPLNNVSVKEPESSLLTKALVGERPKISVIPQERLIEPKQYITVRTNLMPEAPPRVPTILNNAIRATNPPAVVLNKYVQGNGGFQNQFLTSSNSNSHFYMPSMRLPNCSESLRAVRIARPVLPASSGGIVINSSLNRVVPRVEPRIEVSGNKGLSVPPKSHEVGAIEKILDEKIREGVQVQVQEPTTVASPPKQPPLNIQIKDVKKAPKRKLSPEETVQEILSKRRKLLVLVERNAHELMCNKKLVVNVTRTKLHTCKYCDGAAITPEGMKEHFWEHHKVCRLCGFICDSKFELDRHIDTQHPAELRNAMDAYQRRTFEFRCNLCSFEGTNVGTLKEHRMNEHIKEDPLLRVFKCPFEGCPYVNGIKSNMFLHCDTVHDRVIRRQCVCCNHTSRRPFEVKMHLATHFCRLEVKCNICGNWLKTDMHLEVHMRRKHKEQRGQNAGLHLDPCESGLVADEDGRITLNKNAAFKGLQRRTTTPTCFDLTGENDADVENEDIEDGPDLMDFLCQQYIEVPPPDNDQTREVNEDTNNSSGSKQSTGDLEKLLDEHFSETNKSKSAELLDEHSYSNNNADIVIDCSDDESTVTADSEETRSVADNQVDKDALVSDKSVGGESDKWVEDSNVHISASKTSAAVNIPEEALTDETETDVTKDLATSVI